MQQCLWIIKTDPELPVAILSRLVRLVRSSMPNNAYVVASNANFRTGEPSPAGGWRDGAELRDLLRSRLYTGNRMLLECTMAALQGEFSVLETRLDANDGLHVQFLEAIQRAALACWQQHLELQWMYWCSRVEWHWMDPWQRQKMSAPAKEQPPPCWSRWPTWCMHTEHWSESGTLQSASHWAS